MFHCGPGWLSRYRDSLPAGQSREGIPAEAKFAAPVQIHLGPSTQSPVQWVWCLLPGDKTAEEWL